MKPFGHKQSISFIKLFSVCSFLGEQGGECWGSHCFISGFPVFPPSILHCTGWDSRQPLANALWLSPTSEHPLSTDSHSLQVSLWRDRLDPVREHSYFLRYLIARGHTVDNTKPVTFASEAGKNISN